MVVLLFIFQLGFDYGAYYFSVFNNLSD